MDKSLRNTLRNVVTQCRKLLEEAVAEVLEGQFGIYTSGKVEDASRMGHLSADDLEYREQLLIHLQHIQAAGFKVKDAVEQLVREVAFTHLNRFCAYKMMETRALIRKAVSDGLKSQGFLFYLADNPEEEKLYNEGKQDLAYRHSLEYLGSTLSEEIGVLFSPNDPANRLLPPQRVIDTVLNLVNSEELKDIWVEDETIGWVYQYFTPKELRDKARKESQAPRNSYELAFRNQFYTPNYVVQFLTDNTLGRTWYEMRQGETALTEHCQYLVRRPSEIFLATGQEVPASADNNEDLSQEELLKQPVYILHRPKKDPREIKILDPACGSGHFLLYCFTLLLTIYEEAYDDSDLGAALQQDYPNREEYSKAIPGLILAYNLHGIDIDIRATQIAALALWLRAQRAYQEMGLKKNRPKITKSNIVCAEPMPGEKELLDEFTAELQPTVLGQLVKVVFEKMKLAGEAGSLLKIEEEIKDAIAEAKQQWKAKPKPKQLSLLAQYEEPEIEQLNIFDVVSVSDGEFWNQAETLVVEALREYASRAAGSQKLLRQLFAGDAVQGFAFIDICRKKFDVVLMNPPYGKLSGNILSYIKKNYQECWIDILGSFFLRTLCLTGKNSLIGALTSRTFLALSRLQNLREEIAFKVSSISLIADLGFGVLDGAIVETCATILTRTDLDNLHLFAIDVKNVEEDNKSTILLQNNLYPNNIERIFSIPKKLLSKLPSKQIAYWVLPKTIQLFEKYLSLEPTYAEVAPGLTTLDNDRFLRSWWEIDSSIKKWVPLAKGGAFSKFWYDSDLVLCWEPRGYELKEFIRQEYGGNESRFIANEKYYFRQGLTYPRSTVKGFNVRILPEGHIFGEKGISIFPNNDSILYNLLAWLNSRFVQGCLSLLTSSRQWEKGMVASLPVNPAIISSRSLKSLALDAFNNRRNLGLIDETTHLFMMPLMCQKIYLGNDYKEYLKTNEAAFEIICSNIDEEIFNIYEISQHEFENYNDKLMNDESYEENNEEENEGEVLEENNEEENEGEVLEENHVNLYSSFISYLAGCIYGRWDMRIIQNISLAPQLQAPFAPLPIYSPATLVNPNGLPATSGNIVSEEWLRARPDANTLPPEGSVQKPTISDSEYPVVVQWDGILVDDPDHPDDIIRRTRDVLYVIWGDKSEAIEQEACEILGIKDLREYGSKPSNAGFWNDHIKRYSKSRRKAPIYWLLQSSWLPKLKFPNLPA
ncbi:hypothetical protein RIVM261_027920 [Rivularia sp. IAM M-261]|nr:hypothetical protein RIVM261_027920 [Rivularia sp. IAM M-261]